MPKASSGGMDTVMKIRLSGADKKAFEDAAEKIRVSLSAWLRIAGLEKIDREKKGSGR